MEFQQFCMDVRALPIAMARSGGTKCSHLTLASDAPTRWRFISPSQDYNNLCQCESLEDVKLNLQETDYDQFLAQENKVTPAALQDKATKKLVGLALLYPSVLHSWYIRFRRLLPLAAVVAVFLISWSLYKPARRKYTGEKQPNAFRWCCCIYI